MGEGTLCVQALDLFWRKVLMTKRRWALCLAAVRRCLASVLDTPPTLDVAVCWASGQDNHQVCVPNHPLMVTAARGDKETAGAAGGDSLGKYGYAMLAHQWALQADEASEKLGSASEEETGA